MLYYIQKVHNNEIINMKGSATMAINLMTFKCDKNGRAYAQEKPC